MFSVHVPLLVLPHITAQSGYTVGITEVTKTHCWQTTFSNFFLSVVHEATSYLGQMGKSTTSKESVVLNGVETGSLAPSEGRKIHL